MVGRMGSQPGGTGNGFIVSPGPGLVDIFLTCMRLKLTFQLLPARAGMNLSPYLSFCGELTGVICRRGIRGCNTYLVTLLGWQQIRTVLDKVRG